MCRNVGGIERGIRLLVGLVLLGIAFFHILTGALAIAAYVVDGIALVTGVVGFCPAWAICGINTRAARNARLAGSGR
ncbi:MAG TPA: DUF2892 domain-containing protein [Candidatus Acidoferrales bacterium]|nr:DUF2892 domain-containing protein [Candidatus Acidoferrales bacterium]